MSKHTPGPWRWEISESGKQVNLCGGVPKFDLTVMDFVRWGMGGAAPRFRDNSDMGLMQRSDKFAVKVGGREHHAKWFKDLDHPDARLIAAAPDLLAACEALVERAGLGSIYTTDQETGEMFADAIKAAIAKATGGAK